MKKLPNSNKNLKYLQFEFEVKQIEDEDEDFFKFEGLASTFGNIDLVDDVVLQGAFQESLVKRLPIILWQHFSDEPIGMPEFIEERQEGLFIRVKLPKSDTLVSGRVIPQIRVGSVRTMSIGFRIPQGGAFINEDGVRELMKIDLLEVSLVTFPANPQARVTGFKNMTSFLKTIFPKEDIRDEQKAIELIQSLDHLDEDYKKELCDMVKNNIDQQKEFIVDKESLDFLDTLEKVTARSLEKSLRDSGLFSRNAAKKLVSYLNRCDAEENNKDTIAQELKIMNEKIHDNKIQTQLKSMLIKLGG